MKKIDYKSAGVDINAGNEAVELIKDGVSSTFTSNVLTGLGSFGSLYDLKPLLNILLALTLLTFIGSHIIASWFSHSF